MIYKFISQIAVSLGLRTAETHDNKCKFFNMTVNEKQHDEINKSLKSIEISLNDERETTIVHACV